MLARAGVAIVGTRRASAVGLSVARSYARAFARAKLTVISGLAVGIDTAAHVGAMDEHGDTIAVLGSGVDEASLYPRANIALSRQLIAKGGLLISENEPGTLAMSFHHPKRNRLIATLARATVVVEAPEQSGALITAKYALEVGHDVYAVPADVTRESARGSNKLIAFGAPPLLDPNDLISQLIDLEPIDRAQGKLRGRIDAPAIVPHNPHEERILAALRNGPLHVDDVTVASKLPAHTVQATLTTLELRGVVVALGNMQFALVRS